MKREIERALRDLLYHEKESDRVVTQVFERLKTQKMSRRERATFLAFILNAGYYREAYELFQAWFKDESNIPWRSFLTVLRVSGFKPGRQFMDHLISAQRHLPEEERLTHYAPWGEIDPRMRELNEQHLLKLQQRERSRREELIDKLEFVKAERMIEQEQKILAELERMDPKDPFLLRAKEEFRERWARHVITEKSRALFDEEFTVSDVPFTEEEKNWAQTFTELVEEVVMLKPSLAYDLSVGFYFLDLYQQALRLLRYAEENLASDWLRLELLLKARRFIECLDDLHRVEMKYAEDPESTFAATYFRALILRGLGQTAAAVELLKSIVAIRPHYRSAHALLLDWSGGHVA